MNSHNWPTECLLCLLTPPHLQYWGSWGFFVSSFRVVAQTRGCSDPNAFLSIPIPPEISVPRILTQGMSVLGSQARFYSSPISAYQNPVSKAQVTIIHSTEHFMSSSLIFCVSGVSWDPIICDTGHCLLTPTSQGRLTLGYLAA